MKISSKLYQPFILFYFDEIKMNRLSPFNNIIKKTLILMIELTKWSIFLKNYFISAILLANLKSAESSKGFKVYLLGQNLQLLAFIINFWWIFAFWHVDQSDFSKPKNNNKWQMLFLSNSCHSPRRRQRRNTLTNLKKTNNFWKCVGNTLCLKGNSLIFFNNLFIVKSFCLA